MDVPAHLVHPVSPDPSDVAHTLQLFPLLHPFVEDIPRRGSKRNRDFPPETIDPVEEETEVLPILFDTSLLETIPQPHEEKQLTDTLDHIHLRIKRPRTVPNTTLLSLSALSTLQERILQLKPREPLQPTAEECKPHVKRQYRKKVVEPEPLPPMEEWMPPNSYGVVMRQPFGLFAYQTSIIDWAIEREEGRVPHTHWQEGVHGCILAVPMGLGKSLISGTLLMRTLAEQRRNQSCTLYMCPKNLLGTMRYEMEKFFGSHIRVVIYHRDFLRGRFDTFSAYDISQYDMVLCPYDTLTSCDKTGKDATEKDAPEKKEPPTNTMRASETKSDPCAVWEQSHAMLRFPWFRIILDEGHEIRESRTKRFKALAKLHSARRIVQSGTPIVNSLMDVVNQLQFCGYRPPQRHKVWTREMMESHGLLAFVFFASQSMVAQVKLPPKTVTQSLFNLSSQEQDIHDRYHSKTRAVYASMDQVLGREKSRKTMQAQIGVLRLLQICSAPFLVSRAGRTKEAAEDEIMKVSPNDSGVVAMDLEYAFPSDATASLPVAAVDPADPSSVDPTSSTPMLAPSHDPWLWLQNREGLAGKQSSKMMHLVNVLSTLMAEKTPDGVPRKIIIFANFTSTLHLACDTLADHMEQFHERHVLVHGGITSSKKRDEMYTQFRTNPRVQVLMTTLKLGSVGLNLSEATVVIFLELWFSSAAMQQGECRAHRIGSKYPVQIIYFMARNTMEERVWSIAEQKRTLAQNIYGARQFTLSHQSIGTLLALPEKAPPEHTSP